MKNIFIITLLAGSIYALAGCNGDHSAHSNIDTVKNRYGSGINDTTKVSGKNIDTGKVTSTTGDASSIDNSASGGTKMSKDTIRPKAPAKKQ
jgi:hypothetical protein